MQGSAIDLFTVSEEERRHASNCLAGAAAQAASVPGMPAAQAFIRSAAVIGAGTMGSGIALALAAIGVSVQLIDTDAESLERARRRISESLAGNVSRGRLTQAQRLERLALIASSTDIANAGQADIAIEAVLEDMALKKSIFRKLDEVTKAGAILATNTSTLDLDDIASATRRPEAVVGAHFFSPAHVMKLLEVVCGAKTSPQVVAETMRLGRQMGKVSVLSRVHPGFIGNSLFRNYTREAHFLVEEGALPHEVDAALRRFGYAMGIFAVHDMAGNDVGYALRKAQMNTRAQDRRWNDLLVKLCDQGRTGQKSGKGWYRYDKGDRTPLHDPDLEQFLVAESARLGIQRRKIGDEEIAKRCLYSMVNEGAHLLEKRVALRPGDIDVVYATGYGFPAHQGGPMHMADRLGLAAVHAEIVRLHEQHGYWWRPAPLLERLAREGRRFADLQAQA